MTTAAERVVIELVDYALRTTDEQLRTLIDDTIDVEHRSLVYALVRIIVGMIDHGAGDAWSELLDRLALDDDA